MIKRYASVLVGGATLVVLSGCGDASSSPLSEAERSSANARLADLAVSEAPLNEAFDSTRTEYSATVGFLTTAVRVRAVPEEPSATLAVNGSIVASGDWSPVSLAEGTNALSVVVTAENGRTRRSYSVQIERETVQTFAQSAYLKASRSGGINPSEPSFARSLAVDGDTLAVAASGGVYVFTGAHGRLRQQAYLRPPDDDRGEGFGASVALSGDTLAVGATGRSGAVYVFTRSRDAWNEEAVVQASNADGGDVFGWSVAVDGDTLAVGAFAESSSGTGVNGGAEADNALVNAGAVYVFTRSEGRWRQQAYIKAPNTDERDAFGWSLALAGDTLAVGAPFESSGGTGVDSGREADNSQSASGAVYVFSRGQGIWRAPVYVKASTSDGQQRFGFSVALDGDTLAVGAPGRFEEDSPSGLGPGAVHVFTRSAGVWRPQADLRDASARPGDAFGFTVGLAGDTLAIGAPHEDGGGGADNLAFDSGAAYVFTRTASVWRPQACVKASNADPGDAFGRSLALVGDTLIVGAPSEASIGVGVNGGVEADNSAVGSGAAYMFTRRSGAWGAWDQQAYVKGSKPGGDGFGHRLALDGDTLAVAAPDDDSEGPGGPAPSSGAVYVFARSEGRWRQQAYLKASNAEAGDRFGASVALDGDTLVVGAPLEDSGGDAFDNAAPSSGAVYVFARDGGAWRQQAYVKAANPQRDDRFGGTVAVDGQTLVVGPDAASGQVFVFTRSADAWSPQATLQASNGDPDDRFGASLALDDETIVVGAPREDSNGTGVDGGAEEDDSASASGAVYVFTRSDNIWRQQAYVKASNTDRFDNFGASVALDGDTLAVGAPREDGRGTGVNSGPQADNSADGSGAAYVFTRREGVWRQQAYVKASTSGAGDAFGRSIEVDGDTLVIGAPWEDSDGTGVNARAQTDDSAPSSGAVYVFTRRRGVWRQRAYVKAANTDAADRFGDSVAVDGGKLAVGAPNEASRGTGVDSTAPTDNSVPDSGAVYVF